MQMKISVNKEQIDKGIGRAVSIIPSRTGMAALRSLWLKAEDGKIHVMSSDGDIEFHGAYQAEVGTPGLVGIQGHVALDLLRKLPSGVMTFEQPEDGKDLTITTGRKSYKLPVSNAAWFQGVKEMPTEGIALWSGDVFLNNINVTSFCIEKDADNPALSGLQILPLPGGKVRFTGLNSFIFAISTVVNEDVANILPSKRGVLIQKGHLGAIKKWLNDYAGDIELSLSSQRLFLRKIDEEETVSAPIFGDSGFPDVTNALEMSKQTPDIFLSVDRIEFMEALERLKIFSDEPSPQAILNLGPKECEIASGESNNGAGKEIIECDYNGNIERIGFSAKNILEILGHFKSDTVNFFITGQISPCAIEGNDDPGYIVIVSPLNLSSESYYTEEPPAQE